MTLTDFISKELETAREQGLRTALEQGIGEATMKAAVPYARWRSQSIWGTDWDVCLVFDACRWDLFKEVAPRYLDFSQRDVAWSVGSASPEWITETFSDQYSDDWESAGYVTANPFSGKQGNENVYVEPSVYPLADRGLAYLDEVWRDQWPTRENLPTVAPGTVTDRALYAWQHRDSYDIERLVVHYMQPHIPFRSRPEWTDGWDLDGFGTGGGEGKADYHKLRDGELDRDEFVEAYRDNLAWGLEELERWTRATGARILITSDHGNAMGEWGQWDHPPGSANPVLRRVPWVTIDGNGDGGITVEPPGDPPVYESPGVELDGKLEALGYA